MSKRQCPKSEIGGCVRYCSQYELNGFDELMNEDLAEIVRFLRDLAHNSSQVVRPAPIIGIVFFIRLSPLLVVLTQNSVVLHILIDL